MGSNWSYTKTTAVCKDEEYNGLIVCYEYYLCDSHAVHDHDSDEVATKYNRFFKDGYRYSNTLPIDNNGRACYICGKSANYRSIFDIKDRFPSGNESKKKDGCFIATACYGSYYAEEVLILRQFRDDILTKKMAGRFFINIYYFVSPLLARYIQNNEVVKAWVRCHMIDKIVAKIRLDGRKPNYSLQRLI